MGSSSVVVATCPLPACAVQIVLAVSTSQSPVGRDAEEFRPCAEAPRLRKVIGQHIGLGLVQEARKLGQLRGLAGGIVTTLRHCALVASTSSWANAVAMKGGDDALFPACASASRMKCPRHRCEEALSTLATVASMPSWASETTNLSRASLCE